MYACISMLVRDGVYVCKNVCVYTPMYVWCAGCECVCSLLKTISGHRVSLWRHVGVVLAAWGADPCGAG